jgi:hypothetical protein
VLPDACNFESLAESDSSSHVGSEDLIPDVNLNVVMSD